MAIIIKSKESKSIADKIRKMIDDGEIDTWSYDKDGDFTHTGQWRNKAWFSSICIDDVLTFYIVGRKNVHMEIMDYAVFHGRFVELLLNHFPQEISKFEITGPYENILDCDRIKL